MYAGAEKRKLVPSRGARVRFSFLLVGIFEGKILRSASSSRRREKWNKALKKNEAFFEGAKKSLFYGGKIVLGERLSTGFVNCVTFFGQ